MQQRVNELHLKVDKVDLVLKDVEVIETEDGLYVEDSTVLGKTEEGVDINQKRLTYYPSSSLIKMIWSENALVDKVKESVISELIADKFEQILDMYEDDEDESSADRRDDPKFNPYNKKGE